MNVAGIASDYGISADEVRARWLALRVALWKSDFRLFAREIVRIRAKDGDLVPLVLNEAQEIMLREAEDQLEKDRWIRVLILKGRRQGCSTFVAARGYWRATLWDRQNIYILSHEMGSSNTLFGIVNTIHQNNRFPPAVGTDNAKELEFIKRSSRYKVATAGHSEGGRGDSISFFHGSECSRWTDAPKHFASSVQAVDEVRGLWGTLWVRPARPLPFELRYEKVEGWVKPPSEVYLETTSAGPTGEYWKRYMDAMRGDGRYKAIFVPWSLQPEYAEPGEFIAETDASEDGAVSEAEYQSLHGLSDAQMLWRRNKIHELGSIERFTQEYPLDVQEAFSSADVDGLFIHPSLVLKARKRKMDTPDAPLILGVDPAGAGGDRFAIAARRGDKCLWVKFRHKLEHDDAVAWIAEVIREESPARVCIDRGSMGQNIISSLRNRSAALADLVKGIDFGGKSKAKTVNPGRAGPFNMRAEIYQRLRDWLLEGGSIPDDDDLASDLSAPKIRFRANNDWLLESKTDMKARGIRSPDLGDALALTFSVTEYFTEWDKPKIDSNFGSWQTPQEFSSVTLGSSATSWMG